MYDLEKLNSNEKVLLGVKSKDFQGNTVLSEYILTKNDKGYNIAFDKTGDRYQKLHSSLDVESVACTFIAGDRSIELRNFITNNCKISAVTTEDKYKLCLNNVIYYEVIMV